MTATKVSAGRVIRRGLLALALLLVAGVATQALWLGPLLSVELSKRAGRAVHVESMWIGLSSSLAPVVHLRGIRIDNAPWADSDRPFVALGKAVAVFSWTSIAQRRPVIALWVLVDGEVDLERQADGLRNWRLANPEYRGPGRWKVLAVQGQRVTVRFLHGAVDLDMRATASASPEPVASVGAPARPTRIEIAGRWRDVPFTVDATTGEVLTFLETGQTFPVRGVLASGGARVDLEGSAGDIVRDPIVDAHVALTASSLAPFAAFVGAHQREAKAIRVEGTLRTGDGRYALVDTTARLGATDLAGEASWTRDSERSVVRARLDSDSTDVADLRWLAGLAPVRAPAAASQAAAGAVAAASGDAPRTTGGLDAELSFTARRLHAAGFPALQSGRLDAALADGRLTVSAFDVGIAQGHVTGKAFADLHGAPLRADAEITASGIRVEQFTRDAAGKSRVTGALHGHASLKAQGDSAATLRDGVSGRVSASLVGGTISSLLDAEMGLQGGKILRSLVVGTERIAIRCGAATLDFARGAGSIRSLALETERTRTTGTGAIDVGRETMDVVLTPEAKQPGLFILDRSIRLHGPLRGPAHELVARVPSAASAPLSGRGCGRS